MILSRLPFAQEHHANSRHQHENTDDLKWEIVISKKSGADVPHIISCRFGEWRKGISRSVKSSDVKSKRNEQNLGTSVSICGFYFFSFHFKTTPCITPPISISFSL